jgi:hypothetical protein
MIARGFVPEGPGHVHFSFKTFLRDSSALNDALENSVYRIPALVPASPWLDDTPPADPKVLVTVDSTTAHIGWTHPNEGDVFRWVIYGQYNGSWETFIQNRYTRTLDLPRERSVEERIRRRRDVDSVRVRVESLQQIAVSAVDRVGNESGKVPIEIK